MASRNPNAEYIPQSIKVKVPKTTDNALVKDLFLKSERPSIELPQMEGGSRVVSEQVSYTNAEVITRRTGDPNAPVDLSKEQQLNEVEVVAKSRFTPEQNGRINIDFIIRIPHALMSPNFRVTVSPKVLHNDSLVPLKELVLKGDEFARRQKQSYQDYEDYLNSIVKQTDYDSVFVDYDGVRKDIIFQQNFYYEQYRKEWSKQMDYETWRTNKEYADALQEASKIGYDEKTYHANVRKARMEAMKEFAKGKDTTGFYARFMQKVAKPSSIEKGKLKVEQRSDYRGDFYQEYERKAMERVLNDWNNGKDTTGSFAKYMKGFDNTLKKMVLEGEDLKKIPERFRDLYKTNRGMEEIQNQVLTEEDSIAIAQNRYKVEDIALNEMKDQLREERKKEIIIFPYEQGVRLDSVIRTDHDFVYYYNQDYPVTQGLKSVRLFLNTAIDAIDRSRFEQPYSDTLSYFISSMSQLVDASLVKKTTTVHRDMFNSMIIYPKFAPGRHNFSVSYRDNKQQVDTLLNEYRGLLQKLQVQMDSVTIYMTTSLDGDYDKNSELAVKRAEALSDYFVQTLGSHTASVFKPMFSTGEDWRGLARLVARRTDMPNAKAILDTLATARFPDMTEQTIKKLYPQDFKIISDSIYPKLNKAEIVMYMSRPGMTDEVVVNTDERPDYARAIKLMEERQYWEALEILKNYPDYNAALCLVCLGYNQQAYDLLHSLKQTGGTEYLLAILAVRSKDDNLAIQHLLKACELDSSKAYRAPLDPEIATLVNKYNLQSQIEAAGGGASSVE
jgi:hypothetical protein